MRIKNRNALHELIGNICEGYSTHTLGVKSNCRLRYIPNISQPSFSLEIVPALPTLQARENCVFVFFKCTETGKII